MTLIAFTNSAVTPEAWLQSLHKHRAAGAIVSDYAYGTIVNGKFMGCAVGCSLADFGYDVRDHSAYEPAFGIPRILAHLEDGIFEGLPDADKADWPIRFAEACVARQGCDLAPAADHFMRWLLVDPDHGVIRFASGDTAQAIQNVADLYTRKIAGETVGENEWVEAESAADTWVANARAVDAAGWAAWAERAQTPTRAARAAALTARVAAETWAAVHTRQHQADALIRFIGECK